MAKKFQVVTRSAPLLATPDAQEPLASELLYGEVVETIAHNGDFLKCRNLRDGYEGFVAKSSLSDEIIDPTHKIIRPHSNIYAEPDYKTQPITHLSFLSGLALSGEEEDGFVEIEGGGWIWGADIQEIDEKGASPLGTAQLFLGVPYLWGGKTSRGLDCSALVQLALQHTGADCPRDSKDQAKAKLGERLEIDEPRNPSGLKTGDIVFFKGHVGIMVDNAQILNATARSMDVRVEKLADITQHYEGGVLSAFRL